MESVLLILVAVSLAAAVGFAAVAWRLLREDRRRSAARVAALSSALDGTQEPAEVPAVADRKAAYEELFFSEEADTTTGRAGAQLQAPGAGAGLSAPAKNYGGSAEATGEGGQAGP